MGGFWHVVGHVSSGDGGTAGINGPIAYVANCLVINPSGSGIYTESHIANCTVYSAGSSGFRASTRNGIWRNLLAVNSASVGFLGNTSGLQALQNCASFNNTSGRLGNSAFIQDIDPIVLTVDPFQDAAGGDFRLNNLANGGAMVRQIPWPIPGLGQTGYSDGGAVGTIVRPSRLYAGAY
jgi:hypothetical protein